MIDGWFFRIVGPALGLGYVLVALLGSIFAIRPVPYSMPLIAYIAGAVTAIAWRGEAR